MNTPHLSNSILKTWICGRGLCSNLCFNLLCGPQPDNQYRHNQWICGTERNIFVNWACPWVWIRDYTEKWSVWIFLCISCENTQCVCILNELWELHADPSGAQRGKRLREEWQDIHNLSTLPSVFTALARWCLGFLLAGREKLRAYWLYCSTDYFKLQSRHC